jgi:hypothetical protein
VPSFIRANRTAAKKKKKKKEPKKQSLSPLKVAPNDLGLEQV